MNTPSDYIPTTLVEAIRHYADLDVANEFLAKLRWPGGVTCPECGGKEHSYITTRRTWACKACKKRFTVKVGSVMEDSPLGLDKWLVAMWLLADCKNGISSHEVSRHLGISQKSAWFLMHRIRLAMQQGTLEKLGGEIEFRAIPRDQATKEILGYLRLHPHKDSYDIAVALRLDFDLVYELCELLVSQNRLAPSDPSQVCQD